MSERLLRPEEVAERLGVPRSTLYRWAYSGTGPPPLRVGRHVRYLAESVDAFITARAAEAKRKQGGRAEESSAKQKARRQPGLPTLSPREGQLPRGGPNVLSRRHCN
jgi:excisionase family DNA binding protein